MLQADTWFDLNPWFEQLEFIIIAGIVIALAFLALEHRDIVYAAFFFGFMASFVSGFFLILEAPFIAGMQIAVYTGGISALIVFAVLLLPRAQDSSLEVFESPMRGSVGRVVAALVGMLSAALVLFFPWSYNAQPNFPPLEDNLQLLSLWLWSEHGIYVQMTALILLTAIVGAIAILKMDKDESLLALKGEFGVESIKEPIDDEASVEEPSVEEPTEEPSEEVGNE
ncbi:MAG: NADH-quinone oxidoreductase subunit J [Candidatus Thorarchaeota archaeon]|nr:NADH-quinone oxidoreductase subunit J [Candidatus Thorarchaeota archaeon]